MPLFPDTRLLFVHIPKNAGRSVEQALLDQRGSPDGGRRTLPNRLFHALQQATASRFARQYLIGTLDQTLAAQHLTFAELDLLGLLPDDFDSSWSSFCVCRNPFDRAVSSIRHFSASAPGDPAAFERALGEWLDRPPADHNQRAHRRAQGDFVRDVAGRMRIGTVLRFEQLGDDFADLMQCIGRPDIALGWSGKSDRPRDYRSYFTPGARKLVEAAYAQDLELFGYRF